MNLTRLAAGMLLACTLAISSSTALASEQSDAEAIARYVRTPADLANMKALSAGIANIDAQHRAEVEANSARMHALEKTDLYSGATLVSAPAIADTRAALAQLSVLMLDNVAAIHRLTQKAERLIASAPLHKEMRKILDARFQERIAIRIKDTEHESAVLQEFYAALENRLDFAEARLGQLNLDEAGKLDFATPQLQADFDPLQQSVARAYQSVLATFEGKKTGK